MRRTLHTLHNLLRNSLTVNPDPSYEPPWDRAFHKKLSLFAFFY